MNCWFSSSLFVIFIHIIFRHLFLLTFFHKQWHPSSKNTQLFNIQIVYIQIVYIQKTVTLAQRLDKCEYECCHLGWFVANVFVYDNVRLKYRQIILMNINSFCMFYNMI